jgi:uncharacterized OB-fold protein
MTQVPVADGLFTWPADEPQLIGSRCTECGIVTFPVQDSCPRCASTAMEEHLLARQGTLWAWTTQSFPPPAPPYVGPVGKEFVPFGVGFVDLGEVKVEARLTTVDADVLNAAVTGRTMMDLVVVPVGTDDDGNEIVSYAFAPTNSKGTQRNEKEA